MFNLAQFILDGETKLLFSSHPRLLAFLFTSSITHWIVDPDIMVLGVHRLLNERLLEFLAVYSDIVIKLFDDVLSLGGFLLLFPD